MAQKKELTVLIRKLDLDNHIKLLGNIDRQDIKSFLLKLIFIFKLPKSEAAPISIKEAMAAALPIITTDVGGIPELVKHKKTGLLVGQIT